MIELVSDVEGLMKHIKESELPFREAIIDYYSRLGESQGFTVTRNSSVIRNTVNYGRVDLIWVEPNIVFCLEFGVLDDVYKHLFKLIQLKPSLSVLLLSSNSQCKPGKVRDIISKTAELECIRGKSVILDVTGGERIRV
jgi:hypothetical protein